MAKVLLVEDDEEIAFSIRDWLSGEQHIVDMVHKGAEGLDLMSNYHYDLVVLDINLPDISGIEVCSAYRNKGGNACVLMLTGNDRIVDKERGLDAGADDYLTKPFEVRELSARLRSLLRRPAHLISTGMEADGVSLEIETRTVSNGSRSVRLSQREAALLEFLLRHKSRHFSSAQIRDSVWPLDSEGSDDTVRTCMRTLRQKLARIGRADLIRTDLKCGYIIDA